MKILMHCVYFPPEVGGLESHVFHLCRALVAKGHQVEVVTSRSRPGVPRHEVMDGIRVWRTWFPARNAAGWILHSLGSISRTRTQARDADVIHAQAFPSVVPGILARRVGGAPLVTTYHTSHFLQRARRRAWKPVLRTLIRAADHNLAASREIADVAESLAPGIRVEPVTNGVETTLFRPVEPLLPPREGQRVVVVPRRLFHKNGVEYFIRALPSIASRVGGVEALLIGDGPERERLQALATELGVADRIRFMGNRPHEEMPALLRSGELAVFPSLMEATSVAALECMSCGVPVAASRVGGLPEIVDAEVGALFEPADPDDLADTVVELLTGADLEALARAGRERVVTHWSNDRLAERHLEIYRALLAPRRPGPRRERGGSSRPGDEATEQRRRVP